MIAIANGTQMPRQVKKFASVEILLAQLHRNRSGWRCGERRFGHRDQSAVSGRQFAVGDEINLEQQIDD